MEKVFIVECSRTPIGSFLGGLSSLSAVDLGSIVIKDVCKKVGIGEIGEIIDEVFMGNVLSAGLGQNPTKQAVLKANLPNNIPCTTVNKVCASSLKAISLAAQSIAIGRNDVVIAGGMESMSSVPFYLNNRKGHKFGNQELIDGLKHDGLTDPYNNILMGDIGELAATKYDISRKEQDEYSIRSYKNAIDSKEIFKDVIKPITTKTRRSETIVDYDEEPNNFNEEKMKKMRPIFDKQGTITVANASKLNDGAAVVLLMSEKKMLELGLNPLCEIIDYQDYSQEPKEFISSPSFCINNILKKNNLNSGDIDFYEINEAFSLVPLITSKLSKLSMDKINIYGGAVSRGHPLGASGCIILINLIKALELNNKLDNKRMGIASICNGGGGATSMLITK